MFQLIAVVASCSATCLCFGTFGFVVFEPDIDSERFKFFDRFMRLGFSLLIPCILSILLYGFYFAATRMV